MNKCCHPDAIPRDLEAAKVKIISLTGAKTYGNTQINPQTKMK